MTMENLSLNDQHQGIIRSYMQFARYQRQQNLKAVDMAFEDVIDSRLLEATYTREEVEELIHSLGTVVRSDMETELISCAHTNVLLLSQLFSQAEKWHLRLTVDLSEIQNRELLEKVQQLEIGELKSAPGRLKPIDGKDGCEALLRIEIERLQVENARLESETAHVVEQLDSFKEEREKLLQTCNNNQDEIIALSEKIDELSAGTGELHPRGSSDSLERTDPERLLGEYEAVLTEQLGAELESMRQQVLRVQSQLTLAEQELERKFNQTAAYGNMKTMIAKKNEQVKELRSRLLKYEPQDSTITDD